MKFNTLLRKLHPFGWCVALFLISTQSWGQNTVRVQGLGEVELAGDTPTAEEAKEMLAMIQRKEQAEAVEKAKKTKAIKALMPTKEEIIQELGSYRSSLSSPEDLKRFDKIFKACLLDKALVQLLVETCMEIARDPSWFQRLKYD